MPGINQLGGALTVASMNGAPATNENVVAPVPQENTSVQAAPADAVQGVRAAKDVQHESSDATSERQQRQSRKFKELAMRRTQSARGRRSKHATMQNAPTRILPKRPQGPMPVKRRSSVLGCA